MAVPAIILEDAHALVIGISRYVHLETLPPTQDAQDVAAVLQDPACCGYPPSRVHLLGEEAATRAATLDALDALAHATSEASTVFIYYSGHGARADSGRASHYYLIPVDAMNASYDELERTAISDTELTARLRKIPAGRLTLVLDCCHAADMAEPRLAEAVSPMAQGRGRAVLAGSRASGSAYQLPGQRDSYLAGPLVEGLRGAAPGIGGVIRICDLFHYVQQRITAGPVHPHPVFKAELEENYPIAQFHGGAAAPLVLPPPPDDAPYDAFVSYCQEDPDDDTWVTSTLVPFLEGHGLKLCLEYRDFQIGEPLPIAMDWAVTQSRYTVAVFTPKYLADPVRRYQGLLAAYNASEAGAPRFMPLRRRPCQLALHERMASVLDVSNDAHVPAALARLAVALRQVPQYRLTT